MTRRISLGGRIEYGLPVLDGTLAGWRGRVSVFTMSTQMRSRWPESS
jgi:hypothetical protein